MMRKSAWAVVIALGVLGTEASAAPAKKAAPPAAPAKKTDDKKDEKKEEKSEAASEPAVTDAADTNAPRKYGSGWESFGMRGGATLNGSDGLRALFFGGTHFFNDGYGFLGLEAAYVAGMSHDFEMGFGLRFSTWPQGIARGVNTGIGIAPGIDLRWRIVESGAFHLAVTGVALATVTPLGMFGGLTVGLNVEPGLAFSYFIKDNIELYGGFSIPITPLFLPLPLIQIGFAPRLGVAYTLKRQDIGFFAAVDVAPGFYAYGGFPTIENNLATPVVKPGFRVAVNTHLGVQVRF